MEQKAEITYDDFAKLDIRIGCIVAAEMVPDADKLIKCTVDFGSVVGERTIVSGVRQWYAPEELVGKYVPYIINLAPRTLKGVTSEGMLLAAAAGEGADRVLALFEPNAPLPAGTPVS